MTEWYGPIALTTGERPTWLADDDKVKAMRGKLILIVDIPRMIGWGNPDHSYYIPANHWAVAPLRAGYEPWRGGKRAPADWDGASVLLRIGTTASERKHPFRWDHEQNAGDIIGYKKRTNTPGYVPIEQTVDVRRLAKIARALHDKSYGDGDKLRLPSSVPNLLDEIYKYIDAIDPRDKVVREVCDRLRTLPISAAFTIDMRTIVANEIEQQFLPMSDVEQMARAMHAASIDGPQPWETLTEHQRKLWLNSAQWATDRGAKL